MNILILFSQPWRVGGAETHVQALIQGLYGQHVIFLAVNKGSDMTRIKALCGRFPALHLIEIQARGVNIFQWLVDLRVLARLIKENHIDIVSAQQRTAGLWAYMLRKLTGTPFVVTIHDAWHRAIGKRNYAKLFNHMISVSRNLTQRLITDFGFLPEQITLVNNGIDFDTFICQDKTVARQQLGLAENELVILHVSRLSSIKGAVALLLLDTVPFLLEKYPQGKFVVIGEGPLRQRLEEKAAEINKQYGEIVSIHNFTDDILAWYSATDILVGEGRVAIETLACLKPVVAIRNSQYFFGAVTDQNIDEAMQVNFDGKNLAACPEQMAMEIEKALQLPESARKRILASVKITMSIVAMVQRYLAVFQKAITKNKVAV